jgi:hypothetical protein
MASLDSLEQVIKHQDVTNSLISIKKTIRLSCTASSPQYLVLGANTGSLYFFERHSFRFLQLCIFEELQEPISIISFSADEKLLAFATAPPHRNIYITPIPLKGRRKKDLLCISEHKAEIKCLNWAIQKVVTPNKDGSASAQAPQYTTILFSADDSGIVCKTHFAASLLSFGSSTTASNVSVTTDVLYQADSRVNQLSFETELNQLIVSSSTCTALLDFSKGQAFKVGTKPRTGPFGSSFFLHVGVAANSVSASGTAGAASATTALAQSILAARPGNRVWVSQPSNPAKVAQTLNFQTSLQATPPLSLFPFSLPTLEALGAPNKDDLNFHRLVPLAQIALLTWNQNAVFFVDIHSLKIIAWYFLGHKTHGYIADVATTHSHTYVLYHKFEPLNSSLGTSADGISATELQSGNYNTVPLLAHLHVDWNALLAWCIQALDWARTSYILQHYSIDNLALLESIVPFMAKHAVDGNLANEIGRLAKFQIERILTSSQKPLNSSDSQNANNAGPQTQIKSPAPLHASTAPAPSTTDWSSFTEIKQETGVAQVTEPQEAIQDKPSDSSFSALPSSLPSLDAAIVPEEPQEPQESVTRLGSTGHQENPEQSSLSTSDITDLSLGGSTLSVEDPFDFGSSTAPLEVRNAVANVSGDSGLDTRVFTPETTPQIVHTAPVAIASRPSVVEPENIGSIDLSDSGLSFPGSSPAPPSDSFPSPSPPAHLTAEDISSSPIVSSASGAPLASSSSDIAAVGSSGTGASTSASASARRKKKPRAVDIASPSAKLPSAVQSTGVAKLPAGMPVSGAPASNAPPQSGLPMVRSGSGAGLSSSASSLPLYEPPILSTSPSVPHVAVAKEPSSLADSGIRASSGQISASGSPSTTPSSSVTSTPMGSLTQLTAADTTEPHTATQWGPGSPNPLEPSSAPAATSNVPVGPSATQTSPHTATSTHSHSAPLYSTSAPLVGSQSTKVTQSVGHGLLATSSSAIPQSGTTAEAEKLFSATHPETAPPASKQPLAVSGSQPKASTKDELKQLGRDFKNKAKEGFRSLLSALPSPVIPTTTPVAAVAPNATQSISSIALVATHTPSTSHSELPEYVPVTSIQSDSVTSSTIDHLQLYRVLSNGREPMTEAIIYPRLKHWILHFHSHLETLPNAAYHALVTELMTACFEFEVSSPKHVQPAEWDESHALDFVSLYLPSLRLSKVLAVANAHKWSKVIQIILERLHSSYELWKQGNADSGSSEAGHSTDAAATMVPAKGHILAYFNERIEIDAFLEKSDFSVALKRTFSKGDSALIFTYIQQLYDAIPKETVIACAQHYPIYMPHNIETLVPADNCHILQSYYASLMEKHAECRHDEILSARWLDLILESLLAPHQSKLFKKVPKKHIFRLKRLEMIGSNQEGETSVELLPGCIPLLESDIFNGVWLALKDEEYFTFDRSEAYKICLRNGYFRGAMMLAFELEKYEDIQEISIATDDKSAFERLLSYPGAISARNWPFILIKAAHMHALFNHLEQPELDYAMQLTPSYLVSQMSHYVGPHETVNFLTCDMSGSVDSSEHAFQVCETFLSSLPFNVFQQLLLDGKRGEKRKAVISRALKSFDQSMYTKRNAFFGPQISNVEFIEKASAGSRDHPLDHVPFFQKVETSKGIDWAPSFVSTTATAPNQMLAPATGIATTATPSFLGEHGNHWGVHAHFSATSTCLRCGLPLLDPRAGKVAFFDRCSHAYHDTCVEEDACPECLHSSFQTLLSASASPFKH